MNGDSATRAEVFGTSTSLEALLRESVLFLKTGADLPISPESLEAREVKVSDHTGPGLLYNVGAATVLRWLGAESDVFVLVSRGVDDSALIEAAASVAEGSDGDPRNAVLEEPPEGFTFQFASDYFGTEEPGRRVDVGSNAWYSSTATDRVTITATGASEDLFTAAALGTGAGEGAVTTLRGERAIVAPSVGAEPGFTALWRESSDLVAVVASRATREEVLEYAAAARALTRREFDSLTISKSASPFGEGLTVFSGRSAGGSWAYVYDGAGAFTFHFVDARGAESLSSMAFQGDVQQPTIFGGGIFPIGAGLDFVTGMVNRDVTAVQVEMTDGSRVQAELRDPDPDLSYQVFGIPISHGTWHHAVAFSGDREVGST